MKRKSCQYFIFLQPTGASGFEFLTKNGGYAWMVGESGTGTVTATWSGWRGVFQGDPENELHRYWWFDKADWGTYTFDVGVIAPDGDWFYYKWPYCLSVGSHTAWVPEPTEKIDKYYSDLEMRYNYILNDYISNPILPSMTNFKIRVIDNKFDESNPLQVGGEQIGVFYDGLDHNGLIAKIHEAHMYYFDGWRIIFTGEDNCWNNYRRDGDSSRMLAMNYVVHNDRRALDDAEIGRLKTTIELLQVGMNNRNLTTRKETWYVPAFMFWSGTPQRINPEITLELVEEVKRSADEIFAINQFKRNTDKNKAKFKFLVKDNMWDPGWTIFKDNRETDWVIIFGGSKAGDYKVRILQRPPIVILETLLHEMIHASLGFYNNWKYLKTEQRPAPIGVVEPIPFDIQDKGITYLVSREFVPIITSSVVEQRNEAREIGDWARFNYLTFLLNRAQNQGAQ